MTKREQKLRRYCVSVYCAIVFMEAMKELLNDKNKISAEFLIEDLEEVRLMLIKEIEDENRNKNK